MKKNLTKGNQFLKQVAVAMDLSEEKQKVGRILKAVLHVIRNRVPLEISVKFLAHLPIFIKGFYVDGWHISRKYKKLTNVDEFFDEVRKNDWPLEQDLPDREAARSATMNVFRVMKKHMASSEVEEVRRILPKKLRPIWDESKDLKFIEQ